jgi:hypothetical protein
MVQLEELDKFKNPITSLGIAPSTFRIFIGNFLPVLKTRGFTGPID